MAKSSSPSRAPRKAPQPKVHRYIDALVADDFGRLSKLMIGSANAFARKKLDTASQSLQLRNERREKKARRIEIREWRAAERSVADELRESEHRIRLMSRQMKTKVRPEKKVRHTPPKARRRDWGYSSVALPRYDGPVIDRRGKRGVFMRVRYYSRRTAEAGVSQRVVKYCFHGAELDENGNPYVASNVGLDIDEALCGFDHLEQINWSAAKNAKLLMHGILAVDHRQSPDEMMTCGVRWAEETLGRFDLPYLVTLHAPPPDGDGRNWHLHVLWSYRPMVRTGDHEWQVAEMLRAEDDTLDAAAAVAAVLTDNLHGLEIDGRCVQIASFAVALSAWAVGGWRTLPNPHIAWVGSAPAYSRAEFEGLGNGDADLRRSLGALHDLFRQAPLLGSLIEVTSSLDLVDRANLDGVGAAMARLAERTRETAPDRAEGAIAARGMADAAVLLTRDWVLQLTNVPYLGRGKQNADMRSHLERRFPEAKSDLATAMLVRMLRGAKSGGTVSAVTPQNWLFLTSYRELRVALLRDRTVEQIAILGENGFESSQAAGAFTAVVTIGANRASQSSSTAGLDVSDLRDAKMKGEALRNCEINLVPQAAHRQSPDSRIATEVHTSGFPLLSNYADSYQGVRTGDRERFIRLHFEIPRTDRWPVLRNSSDRLDPWHGLLEVIRWESGNGQLHSYARDTRDRLHDMHESGNVAWGKNGLALNQMRGMKSSHYIGEMYDGNVSVIVPKKDSLTSAIAAFTMSPEYSEAVRKIDKKLAVTNATLLKVPFDVDYWSAVAIERYPSGLPEPYSDDPTQWVFHGHPAQAETGTALHVALARLCGYRWPAEGDAKMRLSEEARRWIARAAALSPGDADGLLPLVACGGEAPLAERLRSYARAAFGDVWNADLESRLVAEADAKLAGTTKRSVATIDDWLRNRAFAQHVKLFQHRPFLWHVWDGRDDGFGAFVHYHRLDRAGLEKLTFTLIGDWIARSDADGDTGRSESARALQTRLRAVLDGEAPYDIFVRWKALAQQPIGWDPDLDDGVRMNIRPFVEAGVLRAPVNVHWRKDRGTDVASAPWFAVHKGERINDHHTTLAEKRAARDTTG